jgi:hypothetical protein
MNRRCGAELETAVMRAFGNCCAIHNVSDPQPQPSSRMSWPSARPARSPYSAIQAGAQAVPEEVGRQLVVLAVGGIGVDRQGALAQFGDQRGRAPCSGGRIARVFVAQALRAQPADAGPKQRIRKQGAFGQPEQAVGGAVIGQFHGLGSGVHRSSLGNHGIIIGVVRW